MEHKRKRPQALSHDAQRLEDDKTQLHLKSEQLYFWHLPLHIFLLYNDGNYTSV